MKYFYGRENSDKLMRAGLLSVCLVVAFAATLEAQTPQQQGKTDAASQTKVLAIVDGTPLTGEQVERAAAGEFDTLETQRLQFEIGYKRRRQSILESSLDQLVEEKLLALEASKRGLTKEKLLAAEVESKRREPTEQEVNAFYETNQRRIGRPRAEVVAQIREFLRGEQERGLRAELLSRLREKYKVEYLLEPLRSEVGSVGHPSRGRADAPVTLVEFSDFQCPYCGQLASTLKEVEKRYGDKIRFVFRQFPLSEIHPAAQKAAEASLCANEQGRFWELHDAFFRQQAKLEVSEIKDAAARLGLDAAAFGSCLDSGKYAGRVRQDVNEGVRLGVSGTPALFVNGRFLNGAQPFEAIAEIIDAELSGGKR